MNWFDKGQLGITFVDAPQWIPEAFSIVSTNMTKAGKLHREMSKDKR